MRPERSKRSGRYIGISMSKARPPFQSCGFYHVFNRGNNRESIFKDERNYTYFLKLYALHVSPHVNTFAYCLLRNHFHLLIQVKDMMPREMQAKPQGDRSIDIVKRAFASWFQAYAMAFNKANKRTGKLFEEHFAYLPVTSDSYFVHLVRYIHCNPQKHGFVANFRDWPWSSYGTLTSVSATKLARKQVHEWFDGAQNFQKRHDEAVDERSIEACLIEDFD
jgi:REP element-mobilizing transposase RayT